MMLSHVDATSVSMVVLEELPLLVINSDSGTLLPDQYLYKAHPSPDSDMIRWASLLVLSCVKVKLVSYVSNFSSNDCFYQVKKR